MGDIINLKDYKESAVLEEEYLKFLTHVNKFVGIPTTIPELAKTFYFTLRYLEGSVNCLDMLSILTTQPEQQIQEMKKMVRNYLEGLSEDLQKY